MVIKDSMCDVPECIIPDRYKLILVPQKSKNKLFFEQLTPDFKNENGNAKPVVPLFLKNDFYGRAIVRTKY